MNKSENVCFCTNRNKCTYYFMLFYFTDLFVRMSCLFIYLFWFGLFGLFVTAQFHILFSVNISGYSVIGNLSSKCYKDPQFCSLNFCSEHFRRCIILDSL